jgi:hypothetical protein
VDEGGESCIEISRGVAWSADSDPYLVETTGWTVDVSVCVGWIVVGRIDERMLDEIGSMDGCWMRLDQVQLIRETR